MKKFKSIIVLLVVLAMAMSLMVACRPADDGDDVAIGTKPSGGNVDNTDNDNTNNDATDGDNNDATGGNNDATGGNNDATGGNNTTGGGNNTTGGGSGSGNKNDAQDSTIGGNDEIDASENPLLKKGKPINRDAAVSYDFDKVGFVKNTTLADLKGKTFTLYTGVDYGEFSYYNKSEKVINEWQWFKEIKSLYGVTVKYVRCSPGGSNVVRPFQAMSAGKDIDLITTHVSSFPYICNILEPLDGYVNLDKFSQSVGLDPQLSNLTKWKGKYIILGPCASFGAFEYNRTYIKNCGLPDPYELFRKGEWNWTTFKNYMNGLPATTAQGKKLIGCGTWSQYWYWANTNGKACFEIDGSDPNGNIINNMGTPEVKETFTWLESVCESSKATYYNGDAGTYFWNTKNDYYSIMYYGGIGNLNVRGILEEENKKNEYFWVPFPKNEKNSKAVNHVETYGFGIGIPRKTNKPNNRAAAVKFCELWCNRFTESRFDGMLYKSMWTYDEAIFAYEYSREYSRFGLGSGVGSLATYAGNGKEKGTMFNLSITDASYSTASCLEKLQNYAKQEVANVLKFGIQ